MTLQLLSSGASENIKNGEFAVFLFRYPVGMVMIRQRVRIHFDEDVLVVYRVPARRFVYTVSHVAAYPKRIVSIVKRAFCDLRYRQSFNCIA